ncbi:MAG TPA: NAD(P)-binding domain-containing protein [Microbacterium sp.]|uniref:NADPH-dependent F420 reductase n=1 Tax=Microbacterium sp. TaxID=51671 RepID=UPI002B45FAB3|nr:NAD(P)-binding domain-containing protein [Microbacterium sp.]HKT57485.1 NAD(P)-binding domain-containing protein [Microbacterium sp.]
MSSVGIVGAGRLGLAVARLAVASGHRVLVAGSAGPARVGPVVASHAPGAAAATVTEAASADLVVLAMPLTAYPTLPVAALVGRTVLDATNYWWELDGLRPDLADPATSTSEIVQAHLAGASVVKSLGHMSAADLEAEARPRGATGRKAVAVAGDDPAAVAQVVRFVDDLGFDPVVVGGLAEGIRFEPGTEIFGGDVDAAELRALVARFPDSQRGRYLAKIRARGGR